MTKIQASKHGLTFCRFWIAIICYDFNFWFFHIYLAFINKEIYFLPYSIDSETNIDIDLFSDVDLISGRKFVDKIWVSIIKFKKCKRKYLSYLNNLISKFAPREPPEAKTVSSAVPLCIIKSCCLTSTFQEFGKK